MANMLAAYPNYDGNNGNTFGPKCKRDIGYLIDAVSLDLFVGGNKYSRKFIQEYFDALATGSLVVYKVKRLKVLKHSTKQAILWDLLSLTN